MTTAAQLIAFLQKLPPDTQVVVLKETHRGYETSTNFVPLELPKDASALDCTNTIDFIGTTLFLGEQ